MIDWNTIAMEWLNTHSNMGIFVVDTDLKIRFWNHWMEKHTGKSTGDVQGKPILEIYPEIQARGNDRYYSEALSGQSAILSHSLHQYLIPMPGHCAHKFECMQQTTQIAPLRMGGAVVSIITIIEDVTERKEREKKITASEHRYRTLVENARDAILVIQGAGVMESNRAARTLFGLSGAPEEQEIDFHRFQRAIDPDFLSRLAQRYKDRLAGKPIPELISFQITDRTGEKHWIESNSVSISWEGRPALLTMLRNVTRRKKAENALEAERNRLAITLRSIGDGVIATNKEGLVVLINRAAEKMTGWSFEESMGMSLGKVFRIINQKTRKRCENPVEKVLRTDRIVGLANHTALIARDGSERIIADSGSPIQDREGNTYGVVLVFQDVTEKHKMQEDMARMRNLESLGVFAGGIAHDFNNILAVILGNLNLVKTDLPPSGDSIECAEEAEQATLRAKALAQQLLTFSKGGAPVKQTALLSEVIRESCSFAVRGSNVKCEYDLDQNLWPVEADVEQMSQVLSNLFINAKQAMPRGGCMRISAGNRMLDSSSGVPLNPGRFVAIVIQDEGVGIPEEHLARIFDPYFTTKQTGSGLGLATSHSIIQQHEGHISVTSQPGRGTTFTIHLPASTSSMAPKTPEKTEKPAKGTGDILVMDDDPSIRKMAGLQLKRLGYGVALAGEGKEAIEKYTEAQKRGKPFAAVIMDLTIPGGMGGKEAIGHLRKIDPEVIALVSSGYANDPVLANYKQYGFHGAVPKPFTLKELGSALEQALSGL